MSPVYQHTDQRQRGRDRQGDRERQTERGTEREKERRKGESEKKRKNKKSEERERNGESFEPVTVFLEIDIGAFPNTRLDGQRFRSQMTPWAKRKIRRI